MSKIIQAIRGMNDILPDEAELWMYTEETVRRLFASYGYGNIRMPIVEETRLFNRSIGEVTDIVEKEMYTFPDRNGDSVTLRPEGTAGCVRAVLEHNLLYDGPKKLYYEGPMFRYERPQKGRYRQFHQFGAEALGFAGPDIDAEQIIMLGRLWKTLGLTDVELQINSIGDNEARARHRAALVQYFEAHHDRLDEDARRRLHSNPLRTLDTKNPAMQDLVENAPKLAEYLNDEAKAHFEGLQALLTAAGIPFRVNSRLVRGFDYYNRTVFEWVTTKLGAQGTIAGGGRYDGLVEQLGGKPQSACGFAFGTERLVLLLKEQGVTSPAKQPDAYLVHAGEGATAHAIRLAEGMRDAGLSVLMHGGASSFKSQMKKADASGARFAVIIGDDEAVVGDLSLKPLREGGEQQRLSLPAAIDRIREYH
ncbi:MAG TPA: histidine--tRNA ligase [Burkholderiales bacterium]|nr:histidine--tRNA ligase [Burkholderiales bacterium]